MTRVPYMCHVISLNNQKRTKQSQKQMRVQLGEILSYSQLFQTTNNKHKTPLVGLITQRSEVQILPPQPSVKSSAVGIYSAFLFWQSVMKKCPRGIYVALKMPKICLLIEPSGPEKHCNNRIYRFCIFPTSEDRWVLTPKVVTSSVPGSQSINPVIAGFYSKS